MKKSTSPFFQKKEEIENWDKLYKKSVIPWDSGKEEDLLRNLVKKGKLKKGLTLDTGCGQGADIIYLRENGFKVIGLDISIYPLKIALKKSSNKEIKALLCQGDALKLPFKDESFNLINDRGCFHHINRKYRKNYCKEAYRVLKPGGQILLRSFSEEYFKNGGSGQPLLKKDIKDTFNDFFETGEIIDYRGRGNRWPVSMSWCLMNKF